MWVRCPPPALTSLALGSRRGGPQALSHARAERTLTGTLTRWGMQMVWDTLSNEMKEFWPDIRHTLHRD